MNPILIAILLTLGLFLGMLACLELGRRYGLRRMAVDPEATQPGSAPVDGPIFALLGRLLAFTFASAASRFEGRRELCRTTEGLSSTPLPVRANSEL